MPRYDRSNRGWFCNGCGTFYKEKHLVETCEARHQAIQDYADEKIDELTLAQVLGYPVDTPKNQAIAIQRIRDFTAGAKPVPERERKHKGAEGRLVNITTIHGDGRTQIPFEIRRDLGLQDGHKVFWYEKNGEIIIRTSEIRTAWREGRLQKWQRP